MGGARSRGAGIEDGGGRLRLQKNSDPVFTFFFDGKKKNGREPDSGMNDVAPPLYGSGIPAVATPGAAPHQQQQPVDVNVKLFELEPVRRREKRGRSTDLERRRRRRPMAQSILTFIFSLCFPLYTPKITRSTSSASRRDRATRSSSR